jgi:hypothetical protein
MNIKRMEESMGESKRDRKIYRQTNRNEKSNERTYVAKFVILNYFEDLFKIKICTRALELLFAH